jgi:hypothetical protein
MAGDGIFLGSSDSRGANGRLLGPARENPYESQGAGIAPAFQLPDGSRPQDQLQPITVPRWNEQASLGQQNLDALASKNQSEIKLLEGPGEAAGHTKSSTDNGASASRVSGADTHAKPVSSNEKGIPAVIGVPAGVLGAAVYSQLLHPPLQHALIPGQLKADALAETGELSKIQKVLQVPRKAYLQAFSSPYLVHTEVRKIASAETQTRQNLEFMKEDAEEHIEALKLRGASVKELKKLASSTASELRPIEDILKAERQVKYLASIKDTKLPGQSLESFLPAEQAQLNFLNRNKDYLPGGSAGEDPLSWTKLSESMQKSKMFPEWELEPVMNLAAKEKPFFQLGKMTLSRHELQSFSKGMEDLSVSDFFKNANNRELAGKIGEKFVRSGLIVGTESAAQCGLSDLFANHQQEGLARIVEPTIPGAFAKGAALLCGATPAMKRATFAGAQLFELESNMTPLERLGTMGAGLLPSALWLAKGNKGLALTLGVADMMIGAAAQVASSFGSGAKFAVTEQGNGQGNANANANEHEHESASGNHIADRLASHAHDLSQTTMASDVQWLKDIGRNDPYSLTNIYDDAHKRESLPTANSPLDYSAEKYRGQMVIGEAHGETILSQGLTTSQYSKLMNPKAPLEAPIDRNEKFHVGKPEQIDIGGRGVLALIGGIQSANLLENTLAQKPSVNTEEIDAVEKQKKVMVEEVDHLLNDSHATNFESILKDEKFSMFKPTNEYNLIQFWQYDADKYSHTYMKIRETARDYSSKIPRMQDALNSAQAVVDNAKANPQSSASLLASEKMLEARKFALHCTTALTAKLYRDEALMELAQAKYYVQESGNVPGESAKAIMVLGNAATALHNSELFAPGNRDCAQLGADTTVVYQAAKAL